MRFSRSRRLTRPVSPLPISLPTPLRMSMALRAALASLALAVFIQAFTGGAARADAAPEKVSACDFALTGPVYEKWTAAGGQGGRLGCPSEKEIPIAHTPSGATGVQANFSGGASILWHASGDHAGQTYIVQGCFYRLYAQYGGASGWLGFPVGDTVNNPDGQTQAFEGGVLSFTRATRDCTAEHGAPAPPTQLGVHDVALAAADRAPLDLYFDPVRQEYFTTAQGLGAETNPERYQKVRTEAYVFAQHPPGTVPLRAYWNESRGDHLTIGTAEGERAAASSGYEFAGGQGYVFPNPQPDTRPLKLYWSTQRQDFLLVATPEGEADAKAGGYEFVRIEGYAPTSPKP
jgi:hypothetical protein